MASNLRLIPYTSQRHTDELPTQRPGNGLAEARFTHAGWPDETENHPFPFAPDMIDQFFRLPLVGAFCAQLAHRQIL